MKEIADLITDGLAKFQWAIVSLILGLVTLRAFKSPIGSVLTRARSIGKDGLTLSGEPAAVQIEESKHAEVNRDLKNFGLPISLSARKQAIEDELTRRGLKLDSKETTETLIQHLAVTQFYLFAEEVYNVIFGTQITLLKAMNQNRDGIPKEHVDEYVKQRMSENAALTDWTTDSYLAFLRRKNLVVENGSAWAITNDGVGFLAWLTTNGRSENRPL